MVLPAGFCTLPLGAECKTLPAHPVCYNQVTMTSLLTCRLFRLGLASPFLLSLSVVLRVGVALTPLYACMLTCLPHGQPSAQPCTPSTQFTAWEVLEGCACMLCVVLPACPSLLTHPQGSASEGADSNEAGVSEQRKAARWGDAGALEGAGSSSRAMRQAGRVCAFGGLRMCVSRGASHMMWQQSSP